MLFRTDPLSPAPAALMPTPQVWGGQLEDFARSFRYADMADIQERTREQMDRAQEQVLRAQERMELANSQIGTNYKVFSGTPMALPQARTLVNSFGKSSDENLYRSGLDLIDNHRYDQALAEFNTIVSRNGTRAEGALYWKAYTLNKLGRSSEAQAAIEQLRKTYASSHWLDDAKALEVEVKASSGKPVSPEAETDEDIKVLALNGLMQSDPERALPQVEKMLKGSHSPKLKRQIVYVIAQSNTPRAQQDLEQVARTGNPDLQLTAIRYLGSKRNANNGALFAEIYAASNDISVKSSILNSFRASKDKDRLLPIAKTEKDPDLRRSAIAGLGDIDGQPELWQLYQAETTPEGKVAILNAMQRNGSTEKLLDVARKDSDPKVRQTAIRIIATQETGTPSASIATLYASEQDDKVKQTIIDNLSNSRNCKSLIDVARSETKNVNMKLRIVERLSNMTKSCKEATDYLTEILSK